MTAVIHTNELGVNPLILGLGLFTMSSDSSTGASGGKTDQLNASSKAAVENVSEKHQMQTELHLTETTGEGDILETSGMAEKSSPISEL